jgi:hypothetical protein
VRIEQSLVCENARNGLCVYGEWSRESKAYAHADVVIHSVTAHRNSGIAGLNRKHSGSGIILADVDGGRIERCVASDNGWRCDSREGGPVGIWTHDSNAVVIQHNRSSRNRTGGRFDGGGFDLDGGVTNSVMQYNYSHDNEGAGFLLAQYESARPFFGNVVRHNVSWNDGRRNSYGAIHLFGDMADTKIYDNRIYLPASEEAERVAIRHGAGIRSRVEIRDNPVEAVVAVAAAVQLPPGSTTAVEDEALVAGPWPS